MRSTCVVCNVSFDVELSIKNTSQHHKSRRRKTWSSRNFNDCEANNLNSSHVNHKEGGEDEGNSIFEIFCNYFNFLIPTNYYNCPQQQQESTSSVFFCDECKIVVEQLRHCHQRLKSTQSQIVKIISSVVCRIIETSTIKCVNTTSGSSSVKFTFNNVEHNHEENELTREVQRLRQAIYQQYSPRVVVTKHSHKPPSATVYSFRGPGKRENKGEDHVIVCNQIVKEEVVSNDLEDDLSLHHFGDNAQEESPVDEDEQIIGAYFEDAMDSPEGENLAKFDCDYNPSSPESVDDDDDDGDLDYEETIKSVVQPWGRKKRNPRTVRKSQKNVKIKRTKGIRKRRSSNDDHGNEVVRGWPELKCKRCGVMCEGLRNLKLHINEAHTEYFEKNLTCPFCKESPLEKNENGEDNQSQPDELYTHKQFVVHVTSAHSDKGKLMLGVIQVGVGKFLYFKRCLFEERNDKFVCLHCHTFTEGGQDQMIDHLETVHIHPPLFVCEHCAKTFTAKSLLTEHAVSHSSERPFICEVCGFGAKTLHKLNEHQRNIHSEGKSFKCPHCPKAYKARRLLTQHFNSGVHQGDGGKIFDCPHCDKKFVMIQSRTRHIKNFHTERERTRKHPCPECQKPFFTKSEVTQHLIRCPVLVGPRQRRMFPKISNNTNDQTDGTERNEDEILMDIAMATNDIMS